MNAYALLAADEALRVANQRIAELHREARNERLARASRPRRSVRVAIRTVLSTIRRAIPSLDAAPPALPRLANYPYRP
jgi:hypothetical protein